MVTALGLREARAAGELAAAARDRGRIAGERAAAEATWRPAARPCRVRSRAGPGAGGGARRGGPGARRGARGARRPPGGVAGAGRGAGRAPPGGGGPGSRGRDGPAAPRGRRSASSRRAVRAAAAGERRGDARGDAGRCRAALTATPRTEAAAAAAREAARARRGRGRGRRDGRSRAGGPRRHDARGGARDGSTQLERRLAEDEGRGIAKAARGLGGARVDEELVVEPSLRRRSRRRSASSPAPTSWTAAVASLGGERGHAVVRERLAAADRSRAAGRRGAAAARRRARRGRGRPARRRRAARSQRRRPARSSPGPCGSPDLAAALEVQPALPSAGSR